jgi:hypothetical protein
VATCVLHRYREVVFPRKWWWWLGGGGSLYNITAHTLFHLPSSRPASVLCSSDLVTVELRDTITVIALSKGVVFYRPVSTFILAPPR